MAVSYAAGHAELQAGFALWAVEETVETAAQICYYLGPLDKVLIQQAQVEQRKAFGRRREQTGSAKALMLSNRQEVEKRGVFVVSAFAADWASC